MTGSSRSARCQNSSSVQRLAHKKITKNENSKKYCKIRRAFGPKACQIISFWFQGYTPLPLREVLGLKIGTVNDAHGLWERFLRLLKRIEKLASKKHRTKRENQGFRPPQTLPKSFQNASKIAFPANIELFFDLFWIFSCFGTFDFLKISVSPRREHDFQGVR